MPQQGSSNIFPKIFVVNTTDSQSESEASPVKRPRLLDDSNDRPEESSRSKQKSRRRCFQCQTKLELVQQELGSCRCGEYCLSVASGFSNAATLTSLPKVEVQRAPAFFYSFRDTLNRSCSFHCLWKVIISSCIISPLKLWPWCTALSQEISDVNEFSFRSPCKAGEHHPHLTGEETQSALVNVRRWQSFYRA